MAFGVSFRALCLQRPSSSASSHLRSHRRARSGVRLAFESLESRCLLSGSVNDFSLFSIRSSRNGQIDPSKCDAIVDRNGVEYSFATFNPAGESALMKARMLERAFKFANARRCRDHRAGNVRLRNDADRITYPPAS